MIQLKFNLFYKCNIKYSLHPKRSDVFLFLDFLIDHSSYSKFLYKYYLFCNDLFYH